MKIRKASTAIVAALTLSFTGLVHAGASFTDTGIAPVFNPWDLFQDGADQTNRNLQAAGSSGNAKTTRFAAGSSGSAKPTRFAATDNGSAKPTRFAAADDGNAKTTRFAAAGSTLCSGDAWNCFNQESVEDSTNCSTDAWSCFSIFASLSPAIEE